MRDLIFFFRTLFKSFLIRPEPISYVVPDWADKWPCKMKEIGHIRKHKNIIVIIILCQQCSKTAMESSYSSKYTQWKDGEIGYIVDIWEIDSGKEEGPYRTEIVFQTIVQEITIAS